MSELLIASIHKNAREELRIALTEFNGYQLCAMRVFYRPEDGGEMRPGKNGINVRVEQLPTIIEALKAAVYTSSGETPE
jgi:hypothetical protein